MGSIKDYEHRSIPIPAFLVDALRLQTSGRGGDDPVFYGSRTKTWLRNHTFRNGWFDPAATEVGLEGLTPHELRHTAASLAVSAGANVKAVQRMLGHASASITLDVSADLFDDDLDAVAVALDKAAMKSALPECCHGAKPGTPHDHKQKARFPCKRREAGCCDPSGI